MSGALRGMPWGIDTANHAGIRIRGYTAEQVAPLLAKSAAYDALVADVRALAVQCRHNAQGCTRHESHAAGTWRSCARDLLRLLPDPNPARQIGAGD